MVWATVQRTRSFAVIDALGFVFFLSFALIALVRISSLYAKEYFYTVILGSVFNFQGQ